MKRALLFCDRDGVINEMVVDAEHGTINSPLTPAQVVLRPGVGQALKGLVALGFVPVIVTNQPASAKPPARPRRCNQILNQLRGHHVNVCSPSATRWQAALMGGESWWVSKAGVEDDRCSTQFETRRKRPERARLRGMGMFKAVSHHHLRTLTLALNCSGPVPFLAEGTNGQ